MGGAPDLKLVSCAMCPEVCFPSHDNSPLLPSTCTAALVAFMMLHGLQYDDVAYLRAKDKKGAYKSASDMPNDMNDYIEQHNQLDGELWRLANARLDDAIQQLQPDCFKHHLAVFAKVQAAVKDGCSNYQQFYADHGLSNQTYSYVSDNGIGYR